MNEQSKTARFNGKNPSWAAGCPGKEPLNYEQAVEQFYEALYKFAFGLTGCESDAADLTQDTYQALLTKGGQIREGRKLKSWLFTTLYRRFLGQRRHNARFPKVQVETVQWELPTIDPEQDGQADAHGLVAALLSLDEKYRAPLVLFYLQEHSYREIAAVLDLPIGTIMSRLSRGKEILRKELDDAGPGRFEKRSKRFTRSCEPRAADNAARRISEVLECRLNQTAARN